MIINPTPITPTTLNTELQRISTKTEAPKLIQVFAPDPASPVTAQIIFPTEGIHRIPDCYALAGADAAFAVMFSAVMAEVAALAGLSIAS